MVDVVGAAERESECEAGLQDGVEGAPTVAAQHQAGTDQGVHGDGVAQWTADGHEAVIGHHSQEESLSSAHHGEEEELGGTSLKGYHLGGGQEVDQGLGGDGRWVAQVQEGEVLEEEVHRGVQTGIQGDDHDHDEVPQDGHHVQGQEQSKEQGLGLKTTLKSLQQELLKSHHWEVSISMGWHDLSPQTRRITPPVMVN